MGGRSRKTLPSSTFTGKVSSFMFSSSMWSRHSPLKEAAQIEKKWDTDGQTDRQTDRRTDRQTDRQVTHDVYLIRGVWELSLIHI